MSRGPICIAIAAILALSSTGPSAAQQTGETPAPVTAWAVTAAEPIRLEQPRAVTSVDMDPAGGRLIATGLDGAVRVWSLADGAEAGVFPIHQGDAARARFTADGRQIVSTGADGRVVLTDARTGREARAWRFPTWCLGLDVSGPSRAAVGCADLRIRVLDLGDGRVEREIQAPGDAQYQYISSLSISPDGRTVLVNNPAALFSLETGEQLQTARSFTQQMAFSPDGRRLAGGNMKAGAELWSVGPLAQKTVLLTDVERSVRTPSGVQAARQNMPIYAVAWSPDGRHFASGGLDRLVRIWRVEGEGATEVGRLEEHPSAISALAWRGDVLVSGDLGGGIRIWRLQGLD